MIKKPDAPVVNLAGRRKAGVTRGEVCPSQETAVLGLDRPVALPCGQLAGHEGPHEFRIVWGAV